MFKKTVFSLSLLVFLLLGSTAAVADGGGDTIVYPVENPVFSVTFPEGWKTEMEEDIVHAAPKDESIYLGIWALEDAENLDAALDAVDEAVSSLVKDLDVGEADSVVVNGIQFFTVDGTGKDEDGSTVSVSVALFSPDGTQIFILLYFGTPQAEDAHKDELVEIIKSLNEEE